MLTKPEIKSVISGRGAQVSSPGLGFPVPPQPGSARMPNASLEVLDYDGLPLRWATKSVSGPGPTQLRRWLDGNEVVFLPDSRDRDPLVLASFDVWRRIARMVPLATPDQS